MTQQLGRDRAVDAVIAGHCDRRFADLAAALADEIARGGELGAAIAIDIDGEPVVDMWGGYVDQAMTRQWNQDTIVNVFSSTKNVTALAALLLIDRGRLDPYAPVAKYWPEFAANGKHDVEVRHVLSHTLGCRAGRCRSASKSSTTGRSPPRDSRRRRLGGHRAPRPGTTR